MARSTFGGYGGDQVSLDPAVNSGFYKAAANLPATGTFWSASTGGTQWTDLVDPGTGVALAGVSTDAHGHVAPFKGPDGIVEGWVDFGGGRFKLTAVDSGTFLPVATLDGRYAPITGSGTYVAHGDLIINVKDYGAKGDGTTNDTAAIESAIAAANTTQGSAIYFPRGKYNVAKTSYLADITSPYTSMVGDPGAGTTIQFTSTGGGLSLGNGSAYVYDTKLSNLILDGMNVAATPLRIRKGEELTFTDLRVQNGVTSLADISDTNMLVAHRLQLTTASVGLRLTGSTGLIRLYDSNIYQVTEPVQFGNGSVTDLILDGWIEACPDVFTFANTSVLAVGRIVLRDSRTISTLTNARWFRAKGTATVTGTLTADNILAGCNSATSPVIDFTAVDNSVTLNLNLRRLLFKDRAGGASTLVAKNPATPYYWINVACDDINLYAGLWATVGAVNLTPYRLVGTGTPEGAEIAPVGSTFVRYDGLSGSTLYVKESGTGNTGWSASGAQSVAVAVKTANYTLVLADQFVIFNGASLTATLPDPTTVPVGRLWRVKNLNSSALTVVSAGTTKTLDGAASKSLAQWSSASFASDGTQWLTL